MSDLLPLFEEQRVEVNSWPDRPRYLLSFAYVDDAQVDLCRKYGVDLVIDSGAFTTDASGKQMDHEAYLDWLEANADAITFALSYDVIGDYRASRVNHEIAAERLDGKVKMVPTWHLGSPFEELERMCKAYPFLSIGGAVPFAKQPRSLANAVGQAHRIAARHGAKLHGLGMTGNRIVHGFPWYSVDSSAWLGAVRFPSMPLADEHGRIVQFEHGAPLDYFARQLVAQYGGDPAIVSTPGWSLKAHVGPELALERRLWVMAACARAYMYVEAYKNVNQPHTPIKLYLSGNSGNPGGAVQMLAEAYDQGNPWTGQLPTRPTGAFSYRHTFAKVTEEEGAGVTDPTLFESADSWLVDP